VAAHRTAVFGRIVEDGKTLWRLSGIAGGDGQLAVCNIYVESAAERSWAIAAWQSLRFGNGV
jgi:hypothetical protein